MAELDKHIRTRRFLDIWCDNLKSKDVDWVNASDPTDTYNCFGFAIGRLEWVQEPEIMEGRNLTPFHRWPYEFSDDGTIDTHIRAARCEGFVECESAEWEDGISKIVLYFDLGSRMFTHAARQKSPTLWESKIGMLSDICHALNGLDGKKYGDGRVFMKRIPIVAS